MFFILLPTCGVSSHLAVGPFLFIPFSTDGTKPTPQTTGCSLNLAGELSDINMYKYKYLGCWTDSSNRAMEAFWDAGAGNEVAVEQCARYCGELAYKYFAAQAKTQCFCSNDLGTTKAQGESTNCGACTHNSADAEAGRECGGGWANSVYELRTDQRSPTTFLHHHQCVFSYLLRNLFKLI